MEKSSLCKASTMMLELERRRRMKLQSPQTGKKNANSKHYFEEQNINASISNNKVTKLLVSNDSSQLRGWRA